MFRVCVILVLLAMSFVSSERTKPLDMKIYLQPDDIGLTGDHKYTDYRCDRPCVKGDIRICYYRWVIEQYNTLGAACGACPLNSSACYDPQCVTADGYERGVITVNRRMPGPSIQVCLGDRIIVDVINSLPGRSTTIHWHGVRQKGYPYMDGVPLVTQCPINENSIFRYDFVVKNAGTHFWHSHDGLQKMDGLLGSIVVREPRRNDPNAFLYDFDLPSHVMIVTDWYHLNSDQHFPGLRTHDVGQNPDSYLINGLGRYLVSNTLPAIGNILSLPSLLGPINLLKGRQLRRNRQMSFLSIPLPTPYAVFRVSRGRKYRFRLIGGTCTNCPFELSIEQHSLLVIATDGNPVEPFWVDNIVLHSGDRYDVVLNANQPVRNYWIHVKGILSCAEDQVYQLGILRYIGAATREPETNNPGYFGFNINPTVLNGGDGTCMSNAEWVCLCELRATYPIEHELFTPHPDVHLEFGFGFNVFSKEELFQSGTYHRYFQPPAPDMVSSWLNNISNVEPSSPFISQPEDISSEIFCPQDESGVPTCSKNLCECTHIVKIPLGSVVQILLVDRGFTRVSLNHPFHLHGYCFQVFAVGRFSSDVTLESVRDDLKAGKLPPQTSTKPICKDTLSVPSAGYAVIRFKADNPGFWLFHCHFLYHLLTGMSVVLQVGGHQDLPPIPPGFPRCGNFIPTFDFHHNNRDTLFIPQDLT